MQVRSGCTHTCYVQQYPCLETHGRSTPLLWWLANRRGCSNSRDRRTRDRCVGSASHNKPPYSRLSLLYTAVAQNSNGNYQLGNNRGKDFTPQRENAQQACKLGPKFTPSVVRWSDSTLLTVSAVWSETVGDQPRGGILLDPPFKTDRRRGVPGLVTKHLSTPRLLSPESSRSAEVKSTFEGRVRLFAVHV